MVRSIADPAKTIPVELSEAAGGRGSRGRLGVDQISLVICGSAGDRAIAGYSQPRQRRPDEPPRPGRGQLALAVHGRYVDVGGLSMAARLDENREPGVFRRSQSAGKIGLVVSEHPAPFWIPPTTKVIQ